MTDLDRLIEKHPEIMKDPTGSREGDFVWRWIARDSTIKPEDVFRTSRNSLDREYGAGFGFGDRLFIDRNAYLVAAWRKDYLVSTEEKPKFGSGAKYLPSGRLVEWELDAAGAPMKLTVDGEPVPAEFLSGAKRVTIVETVRFDLEQA